MAGQSQRPRAPAPGITTVYPPYEPADRSGHVIDLGPDVETGSIIPMRWDGMPIDICVICGSAACRHLRGNDGR